MGYGGTVTGAWNTNGTTGFVLLNDWTNTAVSQTRRLAWAFSVRGDLSAVNPIWTLSPGTLGDGILALLK